MTEPAPAVAAPGHNSASYREMLAEDPQIVYRDETVLPAAIAELEREIAEFEYDLATDKGRKAIASLAASFSRLKVPLEKGGLERTKDFRDAIAKVNKIKGEVTEAFDALRDKARAPLTKWEREQDEKRQRIETVINRLRDASNIPAHASVERVDEEIEWVGSIDISPDTFGDYELIASSARELALVSLRDARTRILQAEAERKELEQLRAERAERERAEREAQAESERQRREQEIAAAAEKRAQEAAQRAAEESERQIRAEAQARIAAAERAAAAAEAEARRVQHEQEEAARRAEQEKLLAEREARRIVRDREHVASVLAKVKEALLKTTTAPLTDDQAREITVAISKKKIPGVSLAL